MSSELTQEATTRQPVSAPPLQWTVDRLELALVRHRMIVRRRLDVSDEEVVVLLELAAQSEISQADVTELTGLSRTGAGALIQRLERATLIERRADPADGRIRRLSLSSTGAERLGEARRDLVESLESLLSTISSTEAQGLQDLLERFAEIAESVAGASWREAGAAVTDRIWERWA